MSLVGFRAQNHPQQTVKDHIDDRAITDEDFAPLHERFRFTIDAAAASHNAKLPRYWTADTDALTQPWAGERVWCNPPYSDIAPWVEKANSEWLLRWTEWTWDSPTLGWPGPQLIVMLVPANRTEQGWWQKLVEPNRRSGLVSGAHKGGFHVEFLPGRMRFLKRGQVAIGPNERPPFGCCLLVWGAP